MRPHLPAAAAALAALLTLTGCTSPSPPTPRPTPSVATTAEAPTVTLEAPTQGANLTSSLVEVRGHVTGREVTVAVLLDGVVDQSRTLTGPAQITALVQAPPGRHDVAVHVTGAAGAATAVRTVTVASSSASAAPQSPAPPAEHSRPQRTATSAPRHTTPSASAIASTSPPASPASSPSSSPTTTPDRTPPDLQVRSPANGATIDLAVAGALHVRGIAADASGVTSVEVLLDGTPTPATLHGESFTWSATPRVGKHTVEVRAWDGAGNYTAATRTVTITRPRDQLTVTPPPAS